MKEKIYKSVLVAVGLLVLARAASAGPVTGRNDVAGSIPENTAAGISRSIEITEHGSFSGLVISVNVSHTWIGDLVYTLSHNGTTVKLLDRPGVDPIFRPFGDNSNFSERNSISFADAFTVSAATIGQRCDTVGDVGGSWRPEDAGCANPFYRPIEALSAFTGDVFGTWTLNVSDNAHTFNLFRPEQFVSWSLQASTAEQVPEPGQVPEPASAALALAALATSSLASASAAASRRRHQGLKRQA